MVNRAAAGGTTIASKRISNGREVWKALHGPQDPPRGQLRVRFGLRRLRKWTPEGIRAVGNAADRLDAIKKLLADMDCHYHSIHMTMGEYDLVLIYDAPDDAVAARLTLQIAKKGFVQTKTLKAFPEQAFREIVKSLA